MLIRIDRVPLSVDAGTSDLMMMFWCDDAPEIHDEDRVQAVMARGEDFTQLYKMPIRKSEGGEVNDDAVDSIEEFIAHAPDTEVVCFAFAQILTSVCNMGIEMGKAMRS